MCFGWALREAAKPPSRAHTTRTSHAAPQAARTPILISSFLGFVQRPSALRSVIDFTERDTSRFAAPGTTPPSGLMAEPDQLLAAAFPVVLGVDVDVISCQNGNVFKTDGSWNTGYFVNHPVL